MAEKTTKKHFERALVAAAALATLYMACETCLQRASLEQAPVEAIQQSVQTAPKDRTEEGTNADLNSENEEGPENSPPANFHSDTSQLSASRERAANGPVDAPQSEIEVRDTTTATTNQQVMELKHGEAISIHDPPMVLSAAFKHVHGTRMITLTIVSAGGSSQVEAVLGPGQSFSVDANSARSTSAHVTSVDWESQTLQLTISTISGRS